MGDEYQRKLTELWLDLLKGGFHTVPHAEYVSKTHPIPHVRVAVSIAVKEHRESLSDQP